jgi:predicted DNA-binding protein with PD1-like motif
MKAKLLDDEREDVWAIVFDTGDEVVSVLTEFAAQNQLGGSHFTAIGAFQDVMLGYFDWQRKDYRKIPVREQVEVLSLVGDITLDDARGGKPKVHAHVVVGKSDGTAHGGHLLEGHVRPTLEVTLTEAPHYLHRQYDPESKLALIRL